VSLLPTSQVEHVSPSPFRLQRTPSQMRQRRAPLSRASEHRDPRCCHCCVCGGHPVRATSATEALRRVGHVRGSRSRRAPRSATGSAAPSSLLKPERASSNGRTRCPRAGPAAAAKPYLLYTVFRDLLNGNYLIGFFIVPPCSRVRSSHVPLLARGAVASRTVREHRSRGPALGSAVGATSPGCGWRRAWA